MTLTEQLKQQRVKHIIGSYCLAGNDGEAFDQSLARLFRQYPTPLIELAIVELLVDQWLQVPMLCGCAFLNRVQDYLQTWERLVASKSMAPCLAQTVTPDQFQQITGLDPSPVFGSDFTAQSPSVRSGS